MEYKHLKNIVVYETTKRKKSVHVNKINLCRILEFNRRMNSMEYILPINGKIIVEIKMQDYDNYKTLTRNEFIKYNGGVCFDYVMYEDWYFTAKFSNNSPIRKNNITPTASTYSPCAINDLISSALTLYSYLSKVPPLALAIYTAFIFLHNNPIFIFLV